MKFWIILILTLLFFGCGVSFKPIHMTTDLPETFKNRNVYPDESGILKYKLTQLAGSVIYQEPGNKYYAFKKILLKQGYSPSLEIVKDAEAQIFEGTVNNSVGVKGAYFGFAASLNSYEVATFSIRDRSIVFVNNSDVPWDTLINEARAITANPSSRRYWIQGALLTSLDSYRFTEIDKDASAVVGPTFGVEGKVYNKVGEENHDYKISVYLVDLDKLAEKINYGFRVKGMIPELLRDSINIKDLYPKGISLLKFRESDFK